MSVEHHDLIHEFPEHRDKIHQLKMENNHFKRLFDEYHELTTLIENMENEVVPVTSKVEEQAKIKRIKLKDELYQTIIA